MSLPALAFLRRTYKAVRLPNTSFGGYAKRPFTERRSAEEAHTLRLPFRLTFPR